MPVWSRPDLLAIDLRSYGEDDAAERVLHSSVDELQRIYDRADHYLYGDKYAKSSGGSPLIAWALAMAAIEVMEGAGRPLRWKRRKLKGIYPDH